MKFDKLQYIFRLFFYFLITSIYFFSPLLYSSNASSFCSNVMRFQDRKNDLESTKKFYTILNSKIRYKGHNYFIGIEVIKDEIGNFTAYGYLFLEKKFFFDNLISKFEKEFEKTELNILKFILDQKGNIFSLHDLAKNLYNKQDSNEPFPLFKENLIAQISNFNKKIKTFPTKTKKIYFVEFDEGLYFLKDKRGSFSIPAFYLNTFELPILLFFLENQNQYVHLEDLKGKLYPSLKDKQYRERLGNDFKTLRKKISELNAQIIDSFYRQVKRYIHLEQKKNNEDHELTATLREVESAKELTTIQFKDGQYILGRQELSFEDVKLNLVSQTVSRGDVSVDLSNPEFNVLRVLLENKDEFLTLEEIKRYGDIKSEASVIQGYVYKLRNKLGFPSPFDLKRQLLKCHKSCPRFKIKYGMKKNPSIKVTHIDEENKSVTLKNTYKENSKEQKIVFSKSQFHSLIYLLKNMNRLINFQTFNTENSYINKGNLMKHIYMINSIVRKVFDFSIIFNFRFKDETFVSVHRDRFDSEIIQKYADHNLEEITEEINGVKIVSSLRAIYEDPYLYLFNQNRFDMLLFFIRNKGERLTVEELKRQFYGEEERIKKIAEELSEVRNRIEPLGIKIRRSLSKINSSQLYEFPGKVKVNHKIISFKDIFFEVITNTLVIGKSRYKMEQGNNALKLLYFASEFSGKILSLKSLAENLCRKYDYSCFYYDEFYFNQKSRYLFWISIKSVIRKIEKILKRKVMIPITNFSKNNEITHVKLIFFLEPASKEDPYANLITDSSDYTISTLSLSERRVSLSYVKFQILSVLIEKKLVSSKKINMSLVLNKISEIGEAVFKKIEHDIYHIGEKRVGSNVVSRESLILHIKKLQLLLDSL